MVTAVLLAAVATAVLAGGAESSAHADDVVTVHLVPHTHDDVGWLKTVDQYYSGANNSIQRATVRSLIDSVIYQLATHPDRTFTYVEQAFFQRWYREQSNETRTLTKRLVQSGQLTFVNGGWCMHDEAATHYVAMVDQTTLGHRLLLDEFGEAGVPKVAWQLDPFGHSATQAALLSAEAGMDGLFFGRIDYQDLALRVNESRAEFIWRASPSLGSDTQVFVGLTGEYGGNYGAPSGFDFHITSQDPFIEDDPSLTTYNVKSRLHDFYDRAQWQANHTRGKHIMWTMGSDFNYENANSWYENMDALIRIVNADNRGFRVIYSNPNQYLAAKRAESVTWPLDTGDNADFFPYADGPHKFWTGYFTSRPALKRYVRTCSGDFTAFRQAHALAAVGGAGGVSPGTAQLQPFEEAIGLAQHHDAVSGTAKQHTTFDYAQRLSKGYAAVQPVFAAAVNGLLKGSGAASSWEACPLLNGSICPGTTATASGNVTVVLWNSLGQPRSELVRFPLAVGSTATVTNLHTGLRLDADIVNDETVTNYNNAGGQVPTVNFYADLPTVGAAAFTIAVARAARPSRPAEAGGTLRSGSRGPVVIENAFVALTFAPETNTLVQWTDKVSGVSLDVNQSYCYYPSNIGDRVSTQPSGAYIFRPSGETCVPIHIDGGGVTIDVVHQGDVVAEVQQTFASWLKQTVRLGKNDRHATFEFTVGPIPELLNPFGPPSPADGCVAWRATADCNPNGPPTPAHDLPCDKEVPIQASGYCECAFGRNVSQTQCLHIPFTCKERCRILGGKEVVSRFSTSIASAGELLTDSNGREMLRRQRNFRPTWKLNQTEAVAGNYFPCNAAAAIRDAKAQLTVLVDASQGVASLTDGDLELMVHRRLFVDDHRGVGEPLDETERTVPYDGVGHGEHLGKPLVIRGRHTVTMQPPATAASIWRPLADRVYSPPAVLVSGSSAAATATGEVRPWVQSLANPLPPNLQLMTLQSVAPHNVLLRIAHQFGLGEDASLSQPAHLNLDALFDPAVLTVKAAREVSLTANQNKTQILEQRRAAAKWSPPTKGSEPHWWRQEPPLDWPATTSIIIGPLEIKTFVLTV